MVKTQTYPVEMTVDDLLALHGALNMIAALDDLVGESRDRTQIKLRLDGLRRRFAESRDETGSGDLAAAETHARRVAAQLDVLGNMTLLGAIGAGETVELVFDSEGMPRRGSNLITLYPDGRVEVGYVTDGRGYVEALRPASEVDAHSASRRV